MKLYKCIKAHKAAVGGQNFNEVKIYVGEKSALKESVKNSKLHQQKIAIKCKIEISARRQKFKKKV